MRVFTVADGVIASSLHQGSLHQGSLHQGSLHQLSELLAPERCCRKWLLTVALVGEQ